MRIFIKGNSEQYAQLFDADGKLIGGLSQGDWGSRNKCLPAVHFIRSDLKFSNQVHVSQLISLYQKKSSKAYEPVQLQSLAESLVTFDLSALAGEAAEAKKGQPAPEQEKFEKLKKQVANAAFQTGEGGLERILFEDILKIPVPILKAIRDLRSTQHGYVEQLVEDMNHRLSESLDISEYWQQDEDFTVTIEYKAGFFYFLISDRTGAKYTFDERSGGLKYFLSYYVQAKAVRDSMGPAGAIIVMDEPDGFLSAAGQRNLLSVFELLAQPVNANGTSSRCQVVYTTHSPFLINRNYPDRISLVRKGDAGEGTQLVELASTRQYEPVRTGLGIESSEALFMGSENVVLEGISEQRVLVSAIQRFGDPLRIDDMLDLNRVTIVSAGGVGDVPRLLKSTKRSKERQPIVAVFMDGDEPAEKVRDEIVGEGLIHKDLVCLMSDAGLPTADWCALPVTLEDLVPPRLLAHAVCAFVKRRWDRDQYGPEPLHDKWVQDTGHGGPEKLVAIAKIAGGGLADSVTPTELKSGVYESLSRLLTEGADDFDAEKDALEKFEAVVREICDRIRKMLKDARRHSRQDRLKKAIRLEVERYKKIHGKNASKADVRRCLARLEVLPVGSDDKSVRTRENILKLQQTIEEEVAHAGFSVNADIWNARLQRLLDSPWESGGVV